MTLHTSTAEFASANIFNVPFEGCIHRMDICLTEGESKYKWGFIRRQMFLASEIQLNS
jgi:hypothetical protein